jgi:hypothetical protein
MIERAGPSPEDVIHDPTARLMKLRKVELRAYSKNLGRQLL